MARHIASAFQMQSPKVKEKAWSASRACTPSAFGSMVGLLDMWLQQLCAFFWQKRLVSTRWKEALDQALWILVSDIMSDIYFSACFTCVFWPLECSLLWSFLSHRFLDVLCSVSTPSQDGFYALTGCATPTNVQDPKSLKALSVRELGAQATSIALLAMQTPVVRYHTKLGSKLCETTGPWMFRIYDDTEPHQRRGLDRDVCFNVGSHRAWLSAKCTTEPGQHGFLGLKHVETLSSAQFTDGLQVRLFLGWGCFMLFLVKCVIDGIENVAHTSLPCS